MTLCKQHAPAPGKPRNKRARDDVHCGECDGQPMDREEQHELQVMIARSQYERAQRAALMDSIGW